MTRGENDDCALNRLFVRVYIYPLKSEGRTVAHRNQLTVEQSGNTIMRRRTISLAGLCVCVYRIWDTRMKRLRKCVEGEREWFTRDGLFPVARVLNETFRSIDARSAEGLEEFAFLSLTIIEEIFCQFSGKGMRFYRKSAGQRDGSSGRLRLCSTDSFIQFKCLLYCV